MTPPPWGALGGSDLTAAGLRGLVVCVLRKPVIRALSSCWRWSSKSRCVRVSAGSSAYIAVTCGAGFAIGHSPAVMMSAAAIVSRPCGLSRPGIRSVTTAPRSSTLSRLWDLNACTVATETLRSRTADISLIRSQNKGRSAMVRGDGRSHVIRRCPARSKPRGQADTPALPLPQEQAQEDVLARFEVTQQVGLGEPDPAGDIAEGDLPDGPLTRQLASCREDRLPPLLLVLGPAGALELVGRRHSPSGPPSRRLSRQGCLI